MTTYTHISDLAKEAQPPEKGILSRTIFNDEKIKAVIFGFGQGEELSEHTASMPAILQFIQGVRSEKAISLERQVRIVAGLLVLLGTALGWFVHPAFIGLSAFVGAGLVFAGITDTCGMGMILARMPWNQCSQDSKSCCAR